jgi:iron(III) transport system ATP-binding protein
MGTAVSIRNLTKTYPAASRDAAPLRVVDDVSLDIHAGEVFFLLGPSGCGKTTLLRMIAGFIEPENGRILFGSRDVTHAPAQSRNTGMVFQSYATWPHMTVRGNVAFGLETRGTPAAKLAERVDECLRMVQMSHLADRKPTQLSGGQQQRVALSRAIAVKPEVLLLDEPLSNLDAKLRIELRSEIRCACKAEGITAIYVTHDQREAMSVGDRIALMRSGRIEQLDSPVDLYRRPKSLFAAQFMGEVNIIEGKVISSDGTRTVVDTPWGRLEGLGQVNTERAKILFRPESVRLDQGHSEAQSLQGQLTHVSTVFLGEVWHEVSVLSGVSLRVTGLGVPSENHAASFSVSVADSIVLPA